MARGSGSYRDGEVARRAEQRAREQAARQRERERQAKERKRLQVESEGRDKEAIKKTRAIDDRVEVLEGLLRDSLARDPFIDLQRTKRRAVIPSLDLGTLGTPLHAPSPHEYRPIPPGPLGRLFGGERRYQAAIEQGEEDYARAVAEHQRRETKRRTSLDEARLTHEQQVARANREVAEHNAQVEAMITGVRTGDRYAVSDYLTMVLRASPYPKSFPADCKAGYVPESTRVVVDKYLPSIEAIPSYKLFRHIKTRKAVEATERPIEEIRVLYKSVIAQIALRSIREIFDADSSALVTTIVFNGFVRAVDPVTGQRVEPCLITLRATREQFAALVLDEPKFKPVECIRRHFFADVSPHPDELVAVEPVMPYSMADPRAVDPVDVISGIDKRPNLHDLSPKEFEAFVQNLFAKMGYDTQLFKASGDGGIDCVAYDPHPIGGGKFIIQAKLYTKTVSPTHVRDLWGTVSHEGATKGIMITTSGYGPDSYKFANGKPINLIDGHGLLAICHEHDVPARIVPPKKPGH